MNHAESEKKLAPNTLPKQNPILQKPAKATIPPIAPFGYSREGNRLLIDPIEGPIRKQLVELFLKHGRKKTVARLLCEAGFRTREGALFSDTTIRRLLEDPIAVGVKDESDWAVEPLIDESVWLRCQELLANPAGKTPTHLFAGLVLCSCGSKMYVPSESDKYVCQSCRNKIPSADLEAVFFEQLRSCFLVPAGEGDDSEEPSGSLVQVWPTLEGHERRKVVESITDSIVVGGGEIAINLCLLPSAENATKGQHLQKGNKSDFSHSGAGASGRFKVNVSARELWEGNVQITHLLTETTKNFLAVLGLSVANHINAPLDLEMPFCDGASATAKSALEMLRRQIGAERCRRLIKTERRRGNRPGGVRLGDVEVVGTGRRDVLTSHDPSRIAITRQSKDLTDDV